MRLASFSCCRAPLSMKPLFVVASLMLILTVSHKVEAQSCDNDPQGGGQSISASASIDGTTTQLTDNGFVPAYTRVRLDSIATSGGSCIGMAWYCQTTPCVCQSFNRLVSENGSSFGYDANGNLISKSDSSGNWTYSWDYENHLKQSSL